MKVILWFAILLATGSYICGPIVDPDLWWHITVGKWILAHGEFPTVDYWNMFGVSKAWRAYSWSSELLFAWFDLNWGLYGLLVLKLAFGVLLAFSLFYCLSKISGDWFLGALLGLFSTAACFNHFTLRPQTLVWIFFIWLILWTEDVVRKGPTVKNQGALFLVMVLWANTHITTILGLVTAAAWVWRSKHALKDPLRLFALLFVATLCTPYVGGEWITFFSKTGHPFAHASVTEFQPATIMQFSTGFLIIILVFFLSLLHHRPKSLNLAKLGLALMFVLASLAVVKFLPLAVILLAALIAKLWQQESANRNLLGNLAEAIERAKKTVDRLPREGLSFVFICLLILNVYKVWQDPLSEQITPVAAVNFIKEENLPAPVLNDFGKGGYLIYRHSNQYGEPSQLVPIDGRTNVTPHEVWNKFKAAFDGLHNWHEYIDLVKPQTILWRVESPLSSILLATGDWCSVFRSGDSEQGYHVFVNREFYLDNQERFQAATCDTLNS